MPRRAAVVAVVVALLVGSVLPNCARAAGRVNLSRFTAHVDVEGGPTQVVIPGDTVIELCRDEDGCGLTVRAEKGTEFIAARVHLYFKSGTNEYRLETFHGFDGSNGPEQVFFLDTGVEATVCSLWDFDEGISDTQAGFSFAAASDDEFGRCDLSISD